MGARHARTTCVDPKGTEEERATVLAAVSTLLAVTACAPTLAIVFGVVSSIPCAHLAAAFFCWTTQSDLRRS